MQGITPIQQVALGERVSHELRFLIISGQLGTGERLVESQLSQQFGVSRGPIRDAFAALTAEGLLEARGRGVFVVGLHDDDIAELYSLRQAAESLALKLLVEHANDVDWNVFDEPLVRMEAAAEECDASAYATADLAFHTHFFEQAAHRRLLKLWRQYFPTFTVLLEVTNAQDRDLHPSLASHTEILRSLRAGDLPAALKELTEHMHGAENRLRTAHARVRTAAIDGHAAR